MNSYFERKQTYNQISFRYSCGKSLTEGREIHPYYEILYYIDGGAVFLSEDYHEELTPHSLVIVPKESYHCFKITNQQLYKRLVINFPYFEDWRAPVNKVMEKVRIIKNIPEPVSSVIGRMCEVLSNSDFEDTGIFLYGAFLMLLGELSMVDSGKNVTPSRNNELVFKTVSYIEKNLCNEISVPTIAKALHISQSTLLHGFKKELGISLHRYIMQKRLIYGRRMILEGATATGACFKCGYNNYTAFYKAYIKMFGETPSGGKRV